MVAVALGHVAWAQPPMPCPRACPAPCVPNVQNFGYFPTGWRQWPCEVRPEIVNPRSVGADVLPTPAGQKPVPLPPTGAPAKPRATTPPGAILPPANETPSTPTPPAKTPEGQNPTAPQGGLPGLPVEPEPSANPGSILPPEETKPKDPATPNNAPAKINKARTETRYQRGESAAYPVNRRDVQRTLTILQSEGDVPERPAVRASAGYAHPIAASFADTPSSAIKKTACISVGPAVRLEIIDSSDDGNRVQRRNGSGE
jgi:hypothetical protein